jgi:hypothetical protein
MGGFHFIRDQGLVGSDCSYLPDSRVGVYLPPAPPCRHQSCLYVDEMASRFRIMYIHWQTRTSLVLPTKLCIELFPLFDKAAPYLIFYYQVKLLGCVLKADSLIYSLPKRSF